ncbi:hypothetical protein WJX79_007601 [Trebouxia sp. C0005]|nr:MAG: hypothetical protein FRX49_09933 [Trebouxia sp. A1-2]
MLGFSTIVAFVASAAALLYVKDLRLPYPCFQVVQAIPSEQRPAPSDLQGPYAINLHLQKAKKLFENEISGVETVSISQEGTLYLPDKLGQIWTSKDGGRGKLEQLGYAGGRPLGGHVYANGDAIFCDMIKGLVRVNGTSGLTTILAKRVSLTASKTPGSEIIFADDLDVASDGTVYFTTLTDVPPIPASTNEYDALKPCVLNILQGSAQGRLLSYKPSTGFTQVLADNIWQANGVAVSQDETFVVVASTGSTRLYRYWLKGSKAGALEIFLDNLPGFPDGVSKASDGNFWVAINSAPVPKVVGVTMGSRFLRWVVGWVPALAGELNAYGLILKVSPRGKVLQSFHDPSGTISMVTAVTEYNGKLYTGHLSRDYITVLDLKDVPSLE